MTSPLLSAAALVAIVAAAASHTQAATVEAKSPALADVKSAIASAHEGDTVIVPAGEASWTSPLMITKGITLQGATSIDGSSKSPVVTDRTVVLDDVPRPSHGHALPKQQQGLPQKHAAFAGATLLRNQGRAGSKSKAAAGSKTGHMPAIIIATLKHEQSFRLTGFTFKYGSITTFANNGGVHLRGTSPSARIDHCHFDQLYANPFIMTHGQIYGVVDHCVLDERQRALTFKVFHDGWGGHTHGDGSWADDAYFGSEKFLFIEDNTFRNANGYLSVGIDSYGGGRYVARHNYLIDTPVGGHGTESGGRFRGVRAIEAYNNTCVWNLVEPRGQLRSGTMLEFNNVWTGSKEPRVTSTTLTCYREFWPFKIWGGAGGTNRLDANDTEGNGTYIAGHRPHLYATGNIAAFAGTSTSGTITASGDPNWTTNQWAKYSITNTTQTTQAGGGHSSYITSNTANTITFARDASFGPAMSFNPGDSFAIYKVLIALDQPGRGKGDLLARVDPAAGGSWPHQALEPAYAWGNVYQDGAESARQLNLGSPYPTIQENREFYNQKTPFNGTVGVGVGKLADRPKTCTPGVAYWASDEGEWDSTHEGPDGQLYVCSERDTWSLYYKPYTYPHPLVTGTPASSVKTAQDQGQAKIVEILLEYGFRNLRCFVRPSSQLERLKKAIARFDARANVQLVRGDLLSSADCAKAAEGVSIIYHLAAGFDNSFAGAFMTSALGTRNLIEAFLKLGKPKRFVNVSSFAVYSNLGLKRGGILDETCPLEDAPQERFDAYGFGKLKQEEVVREYGSRYKLPYVILRPGYVFGPGKRELSGRVGINTFGFFIQVNGSNTLPLTFVDNCAEAIVLAGLTPGVDGEVFNVVDDELVSARKFLAAYKKRVNVFSARIPYAVGYVLCLLWEKYSRWSKGQLPPAFNRRRCSAEWKGNRYPNQKLREQLGWRPRVPMKEAMARFLAQFAREEIAQRSEVRGQSSEGRGQRAKDRRQKSDVRGQESEIRDQTSAVRNQECRCENSESRIK